MPYVLVVHLCTNHQPEVGGKERGVELYEAIGKAVAKANVIIGVVRVVGSNLGKENGIVSESMGVRQDHADITSVIWSGVDETRVVKLELLVAELLGTPDDEPVALTQLEVEIHMQVLFEIAVCHAIDIKGIRLAVGAASQRIGLHSEFSGGIADIGIGHPVAVGAA